MSEIWKDVVEFEGFYQVSNIGNFRRHPDKQSKSKYRKVLPLERKTHINKLGYPYATLCKDNIASKKTLHQLVAAAFIPNFQYGMVVNHLDGDKQNNALSNLDVCSHQVNNLHAHRTGLVSKPGKISNFHNVYPQFSRDGKSIIAYSARIKDMYKTVYYKRFKTELEAAQAVDAYLNRIGDTQRSRNFSTP